MLGFVLLSLSLSLYNRRKLFLFFSFNTIIYDERLIGEFFLLLLLLFSFLFLVLIITTVEERKGEGKTIKFYIWAMSRIETLFGWTFSLSRSVLLYSLALFSFLSSGQLMPSRGKNRKKKKKKYGEISSITAPIAFFLSAQNMQTKKKKCAFAS